MRTSTGVGPGRHCPGSDASGHHGGGCGNQSERVNPMSVNPNQNLGTFFRAGERLVGIIHTPTFQGRMVFRPDGREEGRLIASINGLSVGYAELVSAEGDNL